MKVENQTKEDLYKNFSKYRTKIPNEQTSFLKEVFVYSHPFLLKKMPHVEMEI